MYFCCKGITRNYDGVPVIRDVSLHLDRGQIGCLLGPSGVGKTTLMNVLSGVDKPDTGRVFLESNDITGTPGQVSYMLQKDLLLPYKTIIDNVSLPLLLSGKKKQDARREAASYLESFGLTGCEKLYPHQLSGGMRQRAALLRTYLVGDNVLLLDEPFSALDAMTKRQMHNWYLRIAAQLGITTLLITHDIDEALTLSDKIYILTGIPGQITRELAVDAPRPRTADFASSEAFLQQKKMILSAIEFQE